MIRTSRPSWGEPAGASRSWCPTAARFPRGSVSWRRPSPFRSGWPTSIPTGRNTVATSHAATTTWASCTVRTISGTWGPRTGSAPWPCGNNSRASIPTTSCAPRPGSEPSEHGQLVSRGAWPGRPSRGGCIVAPWRSRRVLVREAPGVVPPRTDLPLVPFALDPARIRYDLAFTHFNLAVLYREGGKSAKAAEALRQALEHLERLVREQPGRAGYRHLLAKTHFELGRLHQVDGQITRAAAAWNRSRELLQAWSASIRRTRITDTTWP